MQTKPAGAPVINQRPLKRRMYDYRVMYAFLLPALIVVTIFAYLPMAGLIMSFQNYDLVKGFSSSPFVGFKWFSKFLRDKDFYLALKNTLGINILHILFGFPLPIALAIGIFSMRDSVYKRVTQTISYLPHFISWVVVAGLVYKILDEDTGIFNTVVTAFGGERVAYMRDPGAFWPIIIITAIWKEMGWNTIIYLAALSAIPSEQYEAAIVDGANGRQRLHYITLPNIAPTIGLMLIMTVGNLVNGNGGISFDAVYNLRNALVYTTANTLDYFIFSEGVLSNKLSYATAIGLAQGVVSLLLVMGANSASRKIQGYGAF
jgi:putative aldouronate transport system permease protein